MRLLKLISLSVVLLIALSQPAKSQEAITELLSQSVQDANTLAKAYLEPFGKSFGTSLNNGWYNTAKPHKLFGFDITFNAAVTMPPSSGKTFDVSKLTLNYWQLQTPANNLTPTVTGKNVSGSILVPKAAPTSGIQMQLPNGANLPFVPAPIVQVGIGLPFNTEIVGRFFPKVDIPDVGQFSLWGIGIKNEFKEFIPGFKLLPFNVSALIGYTKFESNFEIDASKDQNLIFEATGFTGKLLISKSIPVLTVYAGVGYNKSTTNVTLKGDYTVTNVGTITDPIALDFTNSGLNANVGLRIKLAIIAFHFDYSVGKYAVYNAGVGINFR